jgi:hypothetical protein
MKLYLQNKALDYLSPAFLSMMYGITPVGLYKQVESSSHEACCSRRLFHSLSSSASMLHLVAEIFCGHAHTTIA